MIGKGTIGTWYLCQKTQYKPISERSHKQSNYSILHTGNAHNIYSTLLIIDLQIFTDFVTQHMPVILPYIW